MAVQSGYRFADGLADAAKRQLFVRGREVPCRPLAFELLLQLCEAEGAVVPREQVFARLWGDEYVPSDEALTQIVHRLRSALGDQGKLVRTVRGVGLRLDTEVVPLAAPEEPAVPLGDFSTRPFLTPGPPPAAAPPVPVRRSPGPRRVLFLGLATLVTALLLAAAGLGLLALRRPKPLDTGYLLTAADLGALPATAAVTEDLLRRAFAAESRGDRSQAAELLETAHRTDPATPVPAVFRVLWGYPEAYPGEGARWATAAERRLTGGSSPYLRLLVRYARAVTSDQDAAEQASLSALLSLRPGAWRLRLARAHRALWRREREAAKADLELIPVHALDQRGLAFVLADRASLGDQEGVERALRTGLLAEREAFAWYVRARLARSRHRPAAALAACDRSLAAAVRRGQPDLILPARLLGAASAFEAGDAAGAAGAWMPRPPPRAKSSGGTPRATPSGWAPISPGGAAMRPAATAASPKPSGPSRRTTSRGGSPSRSSRSGSAARLSPRRTSPPRPRPPRSSRAPALSSSRAARWPRTAPRSRPGSSARPSRKGSTAPISPKTRRCSPASSFRPRKEPA